MDTNITLIVVGLVALLLGFGIAKILEKNKGTQLINSAKKEAETLLKEAKKEGESIKKDKIFQEKGKTF